MLPLLCIVTAVVARSKRYKWPLQTDNNEKSLSPAFVALLTIRTPQKLLQTELQICCSWVSLSACALPEAQERLFKDVDVAAEAYSL